MSWLFTSLCGKFLKCHRNVWTSSPLFVLSFFILTYPPSAGFLVSERLPLFYPSCYSASRFLLYRSSDPVGYFGNQSFSGLTDSLSWQTLCVIDALSSEYAN